MQFRPARADAGPGLAVGAAGDVNGDGYADIVIGEPYAGIVPFVARGFKGAGTAYVLFGGPSAPPGTIDLWRLASDEGFRIEGVVRGDETGFAVAGAGDLNGDGFADLVIGTHPDEANRQYGAGDDPGGLNPSPVPMAATYVVFGRPSGFPSVLHLASLDGATGFRIDGAMAGDGAGIAVAVANDVNGDGVDDLIIGAPWTEHPDRGWPGSSYVLYGRPQGFPGVISLDGLDETEGFRIDGAAAGDRSGYSVSGAGDVNGDGIDDLIIGAPGAAHGGESGAGSAYVVFGTRDLRGRVDLASLAPAEGFRLDGTETGGGAGVSVAGAGDLNGDGIADIVIGAAWSAPYERNQAGTAFVVFGRSSGFPMVHRLGETGGPHGFRIDGAAAEDRAGYHVAAGRDIDGDGIDDLLVGAPNANPSGLNGAGSVHVVFGRRGGFPNRIDLADDADCIMRFDGIAPDEAIGGSAAGVGDFNGDGRDDLLVGGRTAFLVFGGGSEEVERDGVGHGASAATSRSPSTLPTPRRPLDDRCCAACEAAGAR